MKKLISYAWRVLNCSLGDFWTTWLVNYIFCGLFLYILNGVYYLRRRLQLLTIQPNNSESYSNRMAQTVIIPEHIVEVVLFKIISVSTLVFDHCKLSWRVRFYDHQNHNHHHLPFTLNYKISSSQSWVCKYGTCRTLYRFKIVTPVYKVFLTSCERTFSVPTA